MNTTILNQSSFNVNTLTDISNKKSHNKNETYHKTMYRGAYGSFVQKYLEEQKAKRLIRFTVDEKKKLIPATLFDEVEKLVLSKYRTHVIKLANGKDDYRYCWHAYFKDVSLYFDTFTHTEIFICNADMTFIEQGQKRKFRRIQKRTLYHASVLLQLIGGDTNRKYCCDSLIKEYQFNYEKQQKFINSNVLIKEDGTVLEMKNCIKTIEQHKAELLNTIKTIEKIAEMRGMNWAFITLTLPPELHPNPTRGTNSYDGTSPHEANKWYMSKVNLVRAKLRKLEIKPNQDYIYTKVCECHKDGCPHWHILFFFKPEQLNTIQNIFLEVFPNLSMNQDKSFSIGENEDDNFIDEDRFVLNNGKAKPSTYIYKYIMKTTSIVEPNKDIRNLDKGEFNTMLNSAFRSFNGIRGTSFSGLKSFKTKFRFLARNYKRLGITGELADILKNNDMFSFVNDWADKIDNTYKISQSGNRVFTGVKLDGIDYIKSFFKIARNDGDSVTYDFKEKKFKNGKARRIYSKDSDVRLLYKYIVELNKDSILYSPAVLVSHNYTRESQKQNPNPKNYQTDWQNYDDWLRSKIIFNS